MGGSDYRSWDLLPFFIGSVFNIQISWLFPPNCVLDGRIIIFYNCFKKMIKIWNKKKKNCFFWSKIAKNYFFDNFQYKNKTIYYFSETQLFIIFFEVYYVYVAQKLKILKNVKHLFLAWTLATSATSRGPNFDLSNINRVSNFRWRYQLSYEILFVDKNKNLEPLDCLL